MLPLGSKGDACCFYTDIGITNNNCLNNGIQELIGVTAVTVVTIVTMILEA